MDNRDRFEGLLQECGRPGTDRLLAFIRSSDFYTAPASTKYHACYEGGLLEHSLNVYDLLDAKTHEPVWNPIMSDLKHESIVIAGLLHDLCKTNFYVAEYRNKKVYSENGTKSDSNGRFDWQSVPSYAIDDKIPYGHGEKSVMMIEEFIKLEPVERYMIRWHMGFTEPKESWNTLSAAINRFPQIVAIIEADLEATYLKEKSE